MTTISSFEAITTRRLDELTSGLAVLASTLAPHLPSAAHSALQGFVDSAYRLQREAKEDAAFLTLHGQGLTATAWRRLYGEAYEEYIRENTPTYIPDQGERANLNEIYIEMRRRLKWVSGADARIWHTHKETGETIRTVKPDPHKLEMFKAPIKRDDFEEYKEPRLVRWSLSPGHGSSQVALQFAVGDFNKTIVQLKLTNDSQYGSSYENQIDFQFYTWVEVEDTWISHRRMEFLPVNLINYVKVALDHLGADDDHAISQEQFWNAIESIYTPDCGAYPDISEGFYHSVKFSTSDLDNSDNLDLRVSIENDGKLSVIEWQIDKNLSILIRKMDSHLSICESAYHQNWRDVKNNKWPANTTQYFFLLMPVLLSKIQNRFLKKDEDNVERTAPADGLVDAQGLS